jgi:LysM repeat protein
MIKVILLSVFLIVLLILPGTSFAGPDSIGVSTIDGKNYLMHKVDTAEGWFSIAHKYGISYAELRMANKDASDMLKPGMLILVPLDKLNPNDPFYDKNYVLGREELFHEVKEGETLFSIAKRFSTTIDSLKKWNNLSDIDLKVGQRLKVGYKEKNVSKTKSAKATPESKSSETVSVKNNAPLEEKIEYKPAAVWTDTSKNNAANASSKNTDVKGDSTKLIKTASGIKTDVKKSPATLSGKGRKEISETGIASWIRDDDINPNKYYALHRTAPIGTIIRVTNKMNGKYVFVKVVGTLPDTGDNNDLLIKISKASAEKLGVRDSRFQSELSYGITEKK